MAVLSHLPSHNNDKIEEIPPVSKITTAPKQSHGCHFDQHFQEEESEEKTLELFKDLAPRVATLVVHGIK